MNFETYLTSSRKKLILHIKKYCSKRKKENISKVFKEQSFVEELENFVIKGKFLRGSLFLLVIEALGKKINSEVFDIACAIEFMHSSLLIQDDIIDKDYLRRGSKTIFAGYEEFGKKIGAENPYHYGVSSAIVISDIAFFYAMDLITNFKEKELSEILKKYIQEIYLVILAEGSDSLFGQTKREPNKKEIEEIYLHKTARYTFSLPFELAVMIAKGTKSAQKDFNELGELIGFIFQLKDDEIGLLSFEKKIGKPVGSDIRENKKTMIRFYLFKNADKEDKKVLDSCFGYKNAGVDELKSVIKLYKKYKIQEKIDADINKKLMKIWPLYKRIRLEKKYKEILKSLIDYNLKRAS